MAFWIILVLLVIWLIGGSIFKVAEVIFWIVIIVLIIGAGASALRWLNNRNRVE